jgi:uncharacterized membrane protein YfcA
MSFELEAALTFLLFVAAALYTSVGHAGSSAYLAAMGLFGVAPEVMRPTALVLNVLVSSFTSFRFVSKKLFDWRTLWPFLIGALPMAFLGGAIKIPGEYYKPLVGAVLWLAAARLVWPNALKPADVIRPPPIIVAIAIGAGIGLLAGLTGTGGGIFLSPILLLRGWAEPRHASGIAAVFILGNSVFGLAGNLASLQSLAPEIPIYAVAVMAGAAIGTYFGVSRLPVKGIIRALALVLVIAGLKLFGLY